MKFLFIHQNFPAQFVHLINYYAADPNNQVVVIGREYAPGVSDSECPNAAKIIYKPARALSNDVHHYVLNLEAGVLNGQAVAKVLAKLKAKGFIPDLIIAHIGWGEVLYCKDLLPGVPLLGFCEFYYHARGVDADFDHEYPITLDDELKIRTRNAVTLLSLQAIDAGISPTHWQKQLYPKEYHSKITVLHEGIDVETLKPDAGVTFTLPDGQLLDCSMEIVTYASRNLEPYRGFHMFMRAVEEICARRPRCHVLVLGGDDVSYGAPLPDKKTYRQKMLEEVNIDPERIHFLGRIPYSEYVKFLQVSSAHIYLTVPFVLSWSLMEAMAAGCLVIGSNTTPVQEVVVNEQNGLLVDFFDPRAIADAVDRVFKSPDRLAALRKAARNDISKKYGLTKLLHKHQKLYEKLIALGK